MTTLMLIRLQTGDKYAWLFHCLADLVYRIKYKSAYKRICTIVLVKVYDYYAKLYISSNIGHIILSEIKSSLKVFKIPKIKYFTVIRDRIYFITKILNVVDKILVSSRFSTDSVSRLCIIK